jgi:hypothetical protein
MSQERGLAMANTAAPGQTAIPVDGAVSGTDEATNGVDSVAVLRS